MNHHGLLHVFNALSSQHEAADPQPTCLHLSISAYSQQELHIEQGESLQLMAGEMLLTPPQWYF